MAKRGPGVRDVGSRRYGIKGAAKMRRLLKRLPDAMQQEMIAALEAVGPKLLAAVVARTPKRTGALQAGLSYKVFPKTLKLQVGLLGTKKGRAALFYGRILDIGRRAQTVRVVRGTNVSNAYSARMKRARGVTPKKPYTLRVKAITAKRFVSGRLPDLRGAINTELKDIYGRAIADAAEGGSE